MRMTLALAALALGAFVCGCSSESAGAPLSRTGPTSSEETPTIEPPSSPSGSPGDVLTAIDPCVLLTDAEVAQLRADPGQPDVGTSCKWIIPGTGAFGIVLRGSQGLSDIVIGSGQLTDQLVHRRESKQLAEASGPGGCMIAMPVSDTSRVDVQSAARTDTSKACALAMNVAEKIESKLPGGN